MLFHMATCINLIILLQVLIIGGGDWGILREVVILLQVLIIGGGDGGILREVVKLLQVLIIGGVMAVYSGRWSSYCRC